MKLLILFYFLRDCTDGIKIENEKFLEKKRGKMYRVVLIDADDTLFDYEKSEKHAMRKVFEDFGFFEGNSEEKYFSIKEEYKKINSFLWSELEKGNITSKNLRVERFKQLFEKVGLEYDAEKFSQGYLDRLGEGTYLFDGAVELCKYIKSKYKVAIVTNGIKEVQHSRIENSKISEYIDEIIVSEEVGVSKPNSKIFEYAIKKLGCENLDKSEIIMIGDSQTADIKGGINFGIDTCWVNLLGKDENPEIKAKYKVDKLSELYEII